MSFYFVIVLFIWVSFFPQPIQEKYHLFTNVFLILAFLILLAKKRSSVFKLNDYPLWVFLVAISINVLFARQKNIALKTYLDLAIPIFFIYYLVSESLSLGKSFNLLVKTVCVSSIIVSLGGILESIFAFNPIYKHFIENPYYVKYIAGFARPMSTQLNPTALGSYLLGCIPFNYFLFKRNVSFFRLLGAVGIVLNTVVIISTFSRGALLGLIAMIVFYLLIQRKYLPMAIFLIILFVFISAFSYLPYPFAKFGMDWIFRGDKSDMAAHFIKDHPVTGEQDFSRFRTDLISGDGILSPYRLNRFNMVLRIIKGHPFVGLGFQHFRLRFYDYYPIKQKVPYDIMIADNMYLTILAETGLIGFLGFSIFVFPFLRNGWKQLGILNSNSQERWRLLISLMAFIGLLVNMAGYEFFYWPNQYLLFCIVVGCINASLR